MKNKYSDLIDQTFNFPTEEFHTNSKGELQYRDINILGLIEKQAKELGINPLDIKEVKKALQVSDSNSRIYKTYEGILKN